MVNLTREPVPSDNSAPQAISSASTLRYLIDPLTGFAKIAARVFSCCLFIGPRFLSIGSPQSEAELYAGPCSQPIPVGHSVRCQINIKI
jgi:hypothetical protein